MSQKFLSFLEDSKLEALLRCAWLCKKTKKTEWLKLDVMLEELEMKSYKIILRGPKFFDDSKKRPELLKKKRPEQILVGIIDKRITGHQETSNGKAWCHHGIDKLKVIWHRTGAASKYHIDDCSGPPSFKQEKVLGRAASLLIQGRTC